MIEVIEVKTKKQWKEFATFPIKLYKDSKYYVPAFVTDDMYMANEKKNFSAKNCIVKAFLAYKDGILAGRIAGIIVNESNEKFNQKNVRFSRFDFIDDKNVAEALIKAVESFGKEYGMEVIHGPWGFNDADREGMLTFGFDKKATYATNYNFDYYPEYIKSLGFDEESVWIEETIVCPKTDDPLYGKYTKLGSYVKEKYGLRELTDTLSVKQIVKKYGDGFFDCYNEAYKHLDMYIPIVGDAKKVVLKQFATVINPKYLSVLVNENDEVVAFGVILPEIGPVLKKHDGKLTLPAIFDLAKALNKPKNLELTLVGVRPEYAKLGFTAACIGKMMKEINENNIENIVSNPTLLTNTAVRAQWSKFDHKEIKRRKTYIRKITSV